MHKNGYPVLRCRGCGTGHIEPSDFDPRTYYTRDYFEGGHCDGYADYGASAAVLRREFAAVARRLARYAPAGGNLLEIGCAYGYFLEAAQGRWRVYGLEISADAVAHCQASGLRDVRQGTADHDALTDLPALDAVVMLDVVEHLEDPAAVLEACFRKLRPGGVIYLSTGDFASPLARIMRRHWRLMTPPQHIWYFTPHSFRQLAARFGAIIESVSHPGKAVPLSLIIFQLLRVLHMPDKASTWVRGSSIGIPLNLFDAMHVVLRKPLQP
ncbi:MAG TPA: class I SAM-dependent methyltransferase [Candidatus Binataceae bacterium]|nr:class I SAM-dependent methyltransferase [Candidatus Binataceae bacterium]